MSKARDLANLGSDTAALATDAEVSSAVAPKANTTDVNSALATKADASSLSDYVANTIVDAKGDLIVGTAADTPARLAVGTDGQVLTADAASAGGVKWAAAASGLPSQTGNAGKYLTTNGTTASWGTVAAGSMTLLSTITPSAATAVEFNSIPTNYENLLVTWENVWQSNTSSWINVRMNGHTGSNYVMNGTTWSGNTVASYFGEATLFGGLINNAPIGVTTAGSATYSEQAYGYMLIRRANQSEFHQVEYASSGLGGANRSGPILMHGQLRLSAPITNISFNRSATQTINGTFRLWGIN